MKVTESDSSHNNLESLEIIQILQGINSEDQTVPAAVATAIPQIESLLHVLIPRMLLGGRLFYIGAGTSGRLGIVDASECPPTFGVEHGLVVGIIAGGDGAIRKAVEFAEDDPEQGWKDLMQYKLTKDDFVIGIAASGTTPYVIGALKSAKSNGIGTGCITCNPNSDLSTVADYPVEVVVGPEFLTGSTRMKAGTAQKLVLNMISTTAMIKLGRVKGNKMIDMMITNNKLIDRGEHMLMKELTISKEEASELLQRFGSVRKAIDWYDSNA